MTTFREPEPTLDEPVLVIVPWHDDVVDRIGYDPRSPYVETFWLNVFGPTSTWILRRMVTGLDEYPGGYELDLEQTAGALAWRSPGASNPFARRSIAPSCSARPSPCPAGSPSVDACRR